MTHTFTFEVAEGEPNRIEMVPPRTGTGSSGILSASQSSPESNCKVTVMVYDMTGKFLWSTEKSVRFRVV